MESIHSRPSEQAQLLDVVRGVRNRYRIKRALRGAAITVAASWAVLVFAAYVMKALQYGDAAVLWTRIAAVVAILAIVVWFLVRPLLPRLHDDQVALYLEEHETSLRASVITAVEMQHGTSPAAPASAPRSPAIIDRLTRSALQRVHKVGDGRAIDAGDLKMNGGVLMAVVAAAALLTTFGPEALRLGVHLLTTPWGAAAAPVSRFSIAVEPGNTTVARGGDELIGATLNGFQSDRVELLVRSADSVNWARLSMLPDSAGRYSFRLFDIGARTQYAVEANGVRSATYTLDVANLPYVRQLDLQYRYPAYTQLPPQDVDSSGDIAALAGTMVRIRVTPTVPTSGGRVIVDGGDTLALTPTDDGRLTATLRVRTPGFYRIELQGPAGRMVTGSLNYTIDVLPDRPPVVHFTKPGRDEKVLSVDEVYTEASAEDDYGVARLEIVYSVNGGPERTVPLHQGLRAIRDVSAGYTFMLEDFSLEPGDVVSYYARAVDNNGVSGPQRAATDIYFMTVRPYENEYRQGQRQGGGGGGGGGQANDAGQLSQQQREIIAATFKMARDSAAIDKKTLSENLATIRLSQQRLHEQTSQLASRLVERGIATTDSSWKRIADILPVAVAQMDTAEKALTRGTPRGALPSEQRALQQLQRAEAVFREIQVSTGGGGGGGGGGGQRTDASDLADIFELQKDRLRNQYETVQRGQQQNQQQQQADNQVDETLEKLKQLAARQQQQNDRARRKADSLSSQMGASGASGGQGQRDLAQQAEEQARQLERLAREQESQQLADAARRLQDAADAMRRAAANGQRGGDAAQALENLKEARRLLDQEKAGRSTRDLESARAAAQRLAEQERQVQSDVQRLGQAQAGSGEQRRLQQSIADQKGLMAGEVKDLEARLDRMALDASREENGLSRALASAADTLRGRKVEERIRYTQEHTGNAPPDWLASAEEQISGAIATLGRQIQQARTAARTAQGDRQEARAAERARDLVRGVQSLDERMRQRAEQNQARDASGQQQDRQGQQGDAGRQGQGRQNGQTPPGQAQGNQQNSNQQNQNQAGAAGRQNQGQQGQRGQGQNPQGQQGQGNAQGQATGQRQGGAAASGQQTARGGGNPYSGGVPNGNPQGRLSPEDVQQFSREAQQRLADAEALRRDLARNGIPTRELDRAIDNLRQLSNPRMLEDTRAAADLRAKTVEGFKDFEFGLRRRLGESDSTRVLLERSGDVPPAYRQNVEEYYRAIGRGKPVVKPPAGKPKP